MRFAIADTFQKGLDKLSKEDQTLVKQRAFDFQTDHQNPSHQFHRLKGLKEKRFWTVYVNMDIRIIVYKDGDLMMLCYTDHHDAAYEWAKGRQIEVHPETGATQLVELIERREEVVQQIVRQQVVEPPIFGRFESSYLHKLGVPESWLEPLKYVTDSNLLDTLERLPQEAAERLMRLAAGEVVEIPNVLPNVDPFAHPDTQRRFRVVENQTELYRALEWPWERWTTFLHPTQERALQRTYNGPAYVSGGAGTGKTVVALHRAYKLLREAPEGRVLFTTFSSTLASRLELSANILMGRDTEERQRLRITNLHALARQIWVDDLGRRFQAVDRDGLSDLMAQAMSSLDSSGMSLGFLMSEWESVVDSWGIETWDDYRGFPRKGRGTPLDARTRLAVWRVFERVRELLSSQGKSTWNQLCYSCIEALDGTHRWDHIIVDESQDFGPAELRLVRALVGTGTNDVFLVGDSGQQLYQRPFSWRDVGIEVVGRSTNLKVNYRTTEQIRRFADGLMPPNMREHGGQEISRGTVSLLQGEAPVIKGFPSADDEIRFVVTQIKTWLDEGMLPKDIAILGRVKKKVLVERAEKALSQLNVPYHWLKSEETVIPEAVSLGTMHNAKGLEFKAVVVMGCERGTVPLSWVLSNASDDAERDEAMARERNLLYVATTRARQDLVVTYVGEPSEFLSISGV